MVTCWERADLLALVCGVYCGFVTFPSGILGQAWCLILSISDLCHILLSALFSILWLTFYMDSQPQNPEFRNNSEIFHQCSHL